MNIRAAQFVSTGITILILGAQISFAQPKGAYELVSRAAARTAITVDAKRSVQEEVLFPSFGDECTLDLVTLGITDQWGRVSGMNGFGDREKAQQLTFEGSDSYRVVGAMIWFERPAIVGDGTLNCKVYTRNSENGQPDRLVGFSDGIKVSDIIPPDTLSYPTIFTFENGAPVLIDEPRFFLSCDFFSLYGSFDTVVMLQTIDGCGDGGNTWELFANGETWTNIASSISWQINSDFIMSAVVDFEDPSSADSYISDGELTLFPPFPNPAQSQINIPYSVERGARVSIDVFDQTGRYLKQIVHEFIPRGSYTEYINVQNLSAGIYYYRLRTEQAEISSRFQIN